MAGRFQSGGLGMKLSLRDSIGVALIAAFIGALAALFWKSIPHNNSDIITYMLGQLSGFVAAIVAYHYAAKAGEKELEQQRAENTAKAFEAVTAAANATPPGPVEATIVNNPDNPVPVEEAK